MESRDQSVPAASIYCCGQSICLEILQRHTTHSLIMETDTIKWGETYDIEATAQDVDGVAIAMDSTWQAAIRVTKRTVGGATLIEPTMTIAAGKATCTIDTGDAPWFVGVFWYDIRLTDPDGNDQWSEPVRLTLEDRNTPNT